MRVRGSNQEQQYLEKFPTAASGGGQTRGHGMGADQAERLRYDRRQHRKARVRPLLHQEYFARA